jgi:hypothetical protein
MQRATTGAKSPFDFPWLYSALKRPLFHGTACFRELFHRLLR